MSRPLHILRLLAEVVAAAASMVAIETSLRVSTLPATCRWLRLPVDLDSSRAPGPDVVVLPRWTRTPVSAALGVTARWPAGDTCLRRCLLIGHRLRRLDPVLRIGVRRDEAGAFSAHSWLEIDGQTLVPGATGFAALRHLEP